MPHSDAVLLPDNVRPVSYDLTLEPDLDAFRISMSTTLKEETVSRSTGCLITTESRRR